MQNKYGERMKANFLPKNNNIGLVFNCDNKNCLSFAQELIAWGKEKGYNFLLREDEAKFIGLSPTDNDQWRKNISSLFYNFFCSNKNYTWSF